MTWNTCGPTIEGPHSRQGKVHSSANTMVVTASQRHSLIRASAEGRRGDDGEIDVQRPEVRLVRKKPESG